MYGREDYKSAFGHICVGGGAGITNSPVNFTINVYVEKEHVSDGSLLTRLRRAIGGQIGYHKAATLAIPADVSEAELQRSINRIVEN